MLKLAFTEMIYGIWWYRNDKIFGDILIDTLVQILVRIS